MAKVRRFIYVAAPRSEIVHIKPGNTSEGPAVCGRNIPAGWSYWLGYNWRRHGMRLCKRCENS